MYYYSLTCRDSRLRCRKRNVDLCVTSTQLHATLALRCCVTWHGTAIKYVTQFASKIFWYKLVHSKCDYLSLCNTLQKIRMTMHGAYHCINQFHSIYLFQFRMGNNLIRSSFYAVGELNFYVCCKLVKTPRKQGNTEVSYSRFHLTFRHSPRLLTLTKRSQFRGRQSWTPHSRSKRICIWHYEDLSSKDSVIATIASVLIYCSDTKMPTLYVGKLLKSYLSK